MKYQTPEVNTEQEVWSLGTNSMPNALKPTNQVLSNLQRIDHYYEKSAFNPMLTKSFIRSVQTLWVKLRPYLDKKYNTDLSLNRAEFEKKWVKHRHDPVEWIAKHQNDYEVELHFLIYRTLYDFMHRDGWLADKETSNEEIISP